jgi:hypothetical protein
MGFKTKLTFDNTKLKNIIKGKQDLVNHNINAVVKNEAVPHLIDLIMDGYDRLSDRMSSMPDDPTNPANWRETFKTKLHQDLERNLIVTERGLIIRLGEKDYLGYTPSGELPESNNSPEPLLWMVYYLEGLIGEWAFITPEIYERFRGIPMDPSFGRFGDGFMLPRHKFEQEGWERVVSFDAVRHPFSSMSPLDIFTEALNEFKMKPFIEKAIKAAKEGRRL